MSTQKKVLILGLLAVGLGILTIIFAASNSKPDVLGTEQETVIEEGQKKKTNPAIWIAIFASFMGSGVAIFAGSAAKRKKCKSDEEQN